MENNKNSFSGLAKEIMKAGLEKRNVSVPNNFFRIAKEVYNVPEKPTEYNPKRKIEDIERAVLVTGGLDSTVLYFRLKKEYPNIKAFYINIGQPYAGKEMNALKKLGIPFELIGDGDFVKNEKDYWKHIIPARNFYFLSLIAERIKGGVVYFGATDGEMPIEGGDKSKTFLKLVNELFTKLPYPVQIQTPLQTETKTDLITWWINNLSEKSLDNTISCYNSEKGHCGKCLACLRKSFAYINNGLKLKTDIPILKGCQEYIKEYKIVISKALKKKDFNHYSKKRCLQILKALELLEKK